MTGPILPDDDPAAVAAAWFARRRGHMSERNEKAFADWLMRSPAHRDAFENVTRAWAIAGYVSSHPEICGLRAEALATYRQPRFALRRWAAAASIILAVSVAGMIFAFNSELPRREHASASRPVFLQTAIGERSVVTLSDGSVVTLDTGSRLSVAYREHRREVTLLSGQAFFRVAKEPARPFVVVAGSREIVAVGTEFNVRLANDLRVTLLEGQVNVRSKEHSAGGQRFSVAKLSAGEQFVATSNGAVSITRANTSSVASWQQGRVDFDNTPLRDAVAEMNRYSKRPIIIADPALHEIRISGSFTTGQSELFAQSLAGYFPISAEIDEAAISLRNRLGS